ncbi:hypothetical protein CGRA01v4_07933 [Colletotrichum graminicola]|nr:hypothetical protein CGRA01v4_07933 [Colletotrichum graminicola]
MPPPSSDDMPHNRQCQLCEFPIVLRGLQGFFMPFARCGYWEWPSQLQRHDGIRFPNVLGHMDLGTWVWRFIGRGAEGGFPQFDI